MSTSALKLVSLDASRSLLSPCSASLVKYNTPLDDFLSRPDPPVAPPREDRSRDNVRDSGRMTFPSGELARLDSSLLDGEVGGEKAGEMRPEVGGEKGGEEGGSGEILGREMLGEILPLPFQPRPPKTDLLDGAWDAMIVGRPEPGSSRLGGGSCRGGDEDEDCASVGVSDRPPSSGGRWYGAAARWDGRGCCGEGANKRSGR